MAAAATTTATAAAGGGGVDWRRRRPGDDNGDADDFLRVHRAVSSGASVEELRRVIEECAQGDDERRKQAVNQGKTPLQAARRLKRGDLVGALVEAGADVGGILFGGRVKLTPLAVCIAHGQVGSVRALLRAGHDANVKIDWFPPFLYGSDGFSTHAAHFCLTPPPLGLPSDRDLFDEMTGVPQIGCLEVLLREGGADVDARDSSDMTPIHRLAQFGSTYDDEEEKAARDLLVSAGARTSGVYDNEGRSPLMVALMENSVRFARFLIEEAGVPVAERNPRDGQTALHRCGDAGGGGGEMAALLLDAGADVEARDDNGRTPLFESVDMRNTATTRMLLDRGALIDVIDKRGRTPLIVACGDDSWLHNEDDWSLFQEILRRSSTETRRSLYCADDVPGQATSESAVDWLTHILSRRPPSPDEEDLRAQKRCCWAISELLASGTSVRPTNAAAALPIASGLSAGQHAELAARLAELCSWRAQETFVGVSLDFKELKGAEREVEEKRARVAALEVELLALGAGTDDGSSSSDGGEGGSNSGSSSGEGEDDDGESSSSSSEGGGEETKEDGAESEDEGGGGAATGGGG